MKELNETDQAAVSGGGMMGYPWDTPVPPPPGMLPGMPFCLLPTGLAPN